MGLTQKVLVIFDEKWPIKRTHGRAFRRENIHGEEWIFSLVSDGMAMGRE